jgi:hypothetical protein
MVGMSVSKHDRVGIPLERFAQPIAAAVNDRSPTAILDGENRMLEMLNGPRVDVAARPEELQLHGTIIGVGRVNSTCHRTTQA